MNDKLKSSLIKGIPAGLLLALVILAARVFIAGAGFVETLTSIYGILSIICFPLFMVLMFYTNGKKK